MTAWTDNLRGRLGTQAWLDSSQRALEVGYGGPADGDFARYVDQLLAQAEAQRRPRRETHAVAKPGTPPRTRPAAARAASPARAAFAWPRLLPLAFWLLLAVALFFWQGAMLSLVGLLVAGAMAFNAVRRALVSKKR